MINQGRTEAAGEKDYFPTSEKWQPPENSAYQKI